MEFVSNILKCISLHASGKHKWLNLLFLKPVYVICNNFKVNVDDNAHHKLKLNANSITNYEWFESTAVPITYAPDNVNIQPLPTPLGIPWGFWQENILFVRIPTHLIHAICIK